MKKLLKQQTINILVGVFILINMGLLATLWMNKQPESLITDGSISPIEDVLKIDFDFNEQQVELFRKKRKNLRQQVEVEREEMFKLRDQLFELSVQMQGKSSKANLLIDSIGLRQSAIERHTFDFLESIQNQLTDRSEQERMRLFKSLSKMLGPPPPR